MKPEPGGDFGLSLILYLDAVSLHDLDNVAPNTDTSSLSNTGARVVIHQKGLLFS